MKRTGDGFKAIPGFFYQSQNIFLIIAPASTTRGAILVALCTCGCGEVGRVTVAAGGALVPDTVPLAPAGVRTEVIGR